MSEFVSKNQSFERSSSFLCAAENLSPKGFKTVMEIDAQGTFNLCHAAFAEVDRISYRFLPLSNFLASKKSQCKYY